jgi:hypothetical protein
MFHFFLYSTRFLVQDSSLRTLAMVRPSLTETTLPDAWSLPRRIFSAREAVCRPGLARAVAVLTENPRLRGSTVRSGFNDGGFSLIVVRTANSVGNGFELG